jgi:DNA invertase Pin-like site-specific DNA recombinase
MRLIGYVRVSTEEQGASGLGLEAQRDAITRHAATQGWEIARWEEDVMSTREADRPALERALMWVTGPEYQGIIVAKLDRLSRSMQEAAALFATAKREGWDIVSLSPAVDMTDPYGKAMAHMAIVFSELERDMISVRTRDALRAKKARGEPVGRPPQVAEETVELVRRMRLHGLSHRRIAMRLQREGIPTVNGGPWSRSTVQRIINRLEEGA